MLSESFSKIAEACPGEISIQWKELDDVFSVKAADVLVADVTLFGDLLDAVRACQEVSFDYRKLTSDKAERRTVRSHHVGQIEHGWYLIAFDPERGVMRTFALQRISHLAMRKTKFPREAGFNARDHLGGGFGVWNYACDQRRSDEVQIRFEGYAARVVAERQWHPMQAIRKVKPDGSVIEFQADLSGLEEIPLAPPAKLKLTVTDYAAGKAGPLPASTVRNDGRRELPLPAGETLLIGKWAVPIFFP